MSPGWANRHRGEVSAVLDGTRRTMKLTLGALAELEDASGEDLMRLIERLEAGRMSARDALRLMAAGLRGAGAEADEAAVGRMEIEGGPLAAFRLAADLVAAAFGIGEQDAGNGVAPGNGAPPLGAPEPEHSPGGA